MEIIGNRTGILPKTPLTPARDPIPIIKDPPGVPVRVDLPGTLSSSNGDGLFGVVKRIYSGSGGLPVFKLLQG